MSARRIQSLAALLAVVAIGAWGQSLTISPATLPIGGGVWVNGQAIPPQPLTTQFPNDPISWVVSLGALPPGLALGSTGIITGVPQLAGAFSFTVSAFDPVNSFAGLQRYTVYVSTGTPLTLTQVTHLSGAVGNTYFGLLFQVSGGVPGYTWALQSATNADGLSVDINTGFLSGVPIAGGTFPIGMVVTDAFGTQAVASSNLNVLAVGTSSLPDGAIGVPYTQTLAALGTSSPVTWSLVSGSLPPGLSVSAQGQITGTPTTGGTFPFQVQVTDSATNLSSSKSLSINIPLNLTITTTSLPSGTVGTPYPPQTLAATGGSGPLTWSLASGTLPAGLTLSPAGLISGTPTQAGSSSFQVRAVDATLNLSATQTLSITITPLLTVTTSTLPNGTVGINYSQTLQATGGSAPYSWSATGLPAGVTLDAVTGILSGIPAATGVSTISISLTDAARGTATSQLSLTIGTLAITTPSLPNGFRGITYSATLAVTGNPTGLTWAVASGTLPAGLNLSATSGVINGTPTVVGSSTFTISATLASVAVPVNAQKQFTLVISAPPAVSISGLPATGVAATQPSATVSLSGGSYPLNITGTMTLTFASAVGGDDQLVKFSNGTRTAVFTIAAGSTTGLFGSATSIAVLTGTVAGTITIKTTLVDFAGNTLPPPADTVMVVNQTVPVITKVTPGTVTSGGFSISVTGYSTPRDMANAVFHFTAPTNSQLAAADVTVPLTSAFSGWYGNSASNAFGSQFTMTVQFSFTGPPGTTVPYTAVTVTLTNSKGTSNPSSPVSP